MSTTRHAILERLAAAAGEFVSGEALGQDLAVSRAAVAKTVQELRSAGYDIESLPRRGHRLIARPDLLLPFEIQDGLRTAHFGRTIHHYDEIPSTQPVARRLAEAGAPHGTVVVAETQQGGRGRLGRAYACPRGGVWCSVVIRGPLPARGGPLVSLMAGVAAAEAIRAETGLDVLIKWPNDVLVNGRKVAGTLTELVAEDQAVHYLVVGTGINVNIALEAFPPELRTIATSLSHEAGHPVSRAALLRRYLERLEQLWEEIHGGRLRAAADAWRALPNTIGYRVAATLPDRAIEGVATALDDTGALLVRRDDGAVEPLIAADVIHLTPAPAGRIPL